MTLVDTSCFEELRNQRLWSQIYSNTKNTKIYDGISELVSELVKYYKVGIVTSSPRTYAERIIDYYSLNIPVLSAYHDTKNHKPHPEPIIKGCQVLQLNANEVFLFLIDGSSSKDKYDDLKKYGGFVEAVSTVKEIRNIVFSEIVG
ncbi:MAG: HAD hydrolase-like protein [Bacteroidetes bacterium]|nr:HAD hydrolase-like protein [Bacteroidota bacterium]